MGYGAYTGSQASITVFLTILFLLFFSMTGVMIDSARVLSSDGYVRVAAHSAAMTVFGNYNKELYEQYGFFAYGGYDGIGAEDLNMDFLEVLEKNLAAAPEGKERFYADLYRFSGICSEVAESGTLMEKKIFHDQVKGFLKRQAVKKVFDQTAGKLTGDASAAKEKLDITKDYESGKYDELKEADNETDGTGGSDSVQEKVETDSTEQDVAGGNPLSVFSEMMGNGILSLVCDESHISELEIPKREAGGKSDEENTEEFTVDGKKGAADYLSELMENEPEESFQDSVEQNSSTGTSVGEKTELFLYALEQISDYTNPLDKTAKYGLEYLVAGKEKENQNLSYVVNRLLAMRILVNMAYVLSSPVLQEKSLATATTLAGFTGLPPVVSAVQYTILMILCFEEACIDVTALLEGREVPITKNATNFKMKYEEICICTRALFQKKAASYPKAKKISTSGISYQEYLYILFVLQKEKVLRNRMGDLIQYDLRERYNQTFTIHTCICASRYQMDYCNGGLFSSLPFLSNENWKFGMRRQEVFYEYKSK